MGEFVAYSVGLVYASVCSSLSPKEITARFNRECPTGIANTWSLSPDETFQTGEPNPCPCADSPTTHKHYLFAC